LPIRIGLHEHIQLWDAAVVKVVDIRHTIMSYGERLRSYRFPASVFLYALRGSARIRLDGSEHAVHRCYVLHGGKGAFLDIWPGEAGFEYYLIYYKAAVPLPCRPEVLRLMKQYDPFRLQYGFAPLHPASLFAHVDRMLTIWRNCGALDRFQVKALFYQWVCKLLRELDELRIDASQPKLAAQVIRYMEEHYSENMTRELIAHMFHYSVPYVSKRFKQETGSSLIDYLIRIRMENAIQALTHTDATMQQVAAGVGYDDAFYFAKLFKKYTGMTPKQFKQRAGERRTGADRPENWRGLSVVPSQLHLYIDKDSDNHYQYKKEGEWLMHRNGSSLGVALLLIFTLLLSACSGTSNPNPASTGQPSVAEESVQPSAPGHPAASAAAETITYTAANGEVQLPKHPQRVVVLANQYVGDFLALGIPLAGIAENPLNNPFFQGKLDGVENLGDGSSIEKILAIQPDLIIVYDGAANLADLQKVAPTVAVKYGAKGFKDQLIEFGKMTDTESKAREWIAQWEQKIAAYKPKVEAAVAGKTVSILNPYAKGLYVWGSGFGRGGEIIYGEFQLKAPASVQQDVIDSGTGFATISLEKLPEFAGDYIFTSPWLGDQADPAAVYDSVVWKSLPAVKNNHVFHMDAASTSFNDPISLDAELEYVVEMLTKP